MALQDGCHESEAEGNVHSISSSPGLTTRLPYALLRPVAMPWKPGVDQADILFAATSEDVHRHLASLRDAEVTCIDLETDGTDISDPATRIVGVGLAWRVGEEMHARYFEYTSMSVRARRSLLTALSWASVSIAHNLYFDGGLIWREARALGVEAEPNWTYCTYALSRQLGSEAFPGQSYSLKAAQVDLLGWKETNEAGIDTWLLSHGYHKQGPKFREGEDPAAHLSRIEKWIAVNPEKRSVAPDKSQMWRVPHTILGEYGILDCISTVQLFDDVLWPVLEKFPELDEFHRHAFVHMDRLLWTSSFDGIPLDVEKMAAHAKYLAEMLVVAEQGMRASALGPHIAQIETELRQKKVAAEPEKYRKFKLGPEPTKYTKEGRESKAWLSWEARRLAGPAISRNWEKWRSMVDTIERGALPKYNFNPDSPAHLKRILYDSGIVEWRTTDRTSYRKGKQLPVFEINGINGWVDLVGTDAGELPTSGDLYTQLPPEIGAPLQLYADAAQELGYADTYIKLARAHPDGIHRIHPGWISPGTKTLRLAGGGSKRSIVDRRGKNKEASINLAQVTKTIQFMECLVAEPGQVWFEFDWSSIEPHVLAELSRDPALLNLYGPGAKKHDVYLYSGAGYAVFGEEVRKYYDVDNPDVPAAKKALKELRDKVLKKTVLGKQYGAMWRKLLSSYRLEGYVVTDEQARQISDSHDDMYRVSGREFRQLLEDEWEMRGGYILSAHGFPTPIWEGRLKDVINACIQRSAHDCHTMFVAALDRRLRSEGIKFKWVVPDFHDQAIGSCRVEDGGRVLEIIREEVAAFNQRLGTYVTLKAEPKLSTNLAHAKEAELDWHEHEAALRAKFAA